MEAAIDFEYAGLVGNNPNMDNPHARLLTAILLNAVHDAVASQSSVLQKRQAWQWLQEDEGLIYYCLSVVRLDRGALIRRISYMKSNNINLKNMYTKRETL